MRIVTSLATAALLGLAPALAQDSGQKAQNDNQSQQKPAPTTPSSSDPLLRMLQSQDNSNAPVADPQKSDTKSPAASDTPQQKPQDIAPAAGPPPSQTGPSQPAPSTVPPVMPSATAPVPPAPDDINKPGTPVSGANSFTAGQAKSRLERYGFKDVGALKKDDRGVWRGQATDRTGARVNVGVDYQGNIVAN
jgi:putative membrane protein